MAWEHDTYKATCQSCGKEGTCTISSDDWSRSKTSWSGFNNKSPDITRVARKRASSDDMSPVCDCGSLNVVRGELIESR